MLSVKRISKTYPGFGIKDVSFDVQFAKDRQVWPTLRLRRPLDQSPVRHPVLFSQVTVAETFDQQLQTCPTGLQQLREGLRFDLVDGRLQPDSVRDDGEKTTNHPAQFPPLGSEHLFWHHDFRTSVAKEASQVHFPLPSSCHMRSNCSSRER